MTLHDALVLRTRDDALFKFALRRRQSPRVRVNVNANTSTVKLWGRSPVGEKTGRLFVGSATVSAFAVTVTGTAVAVVTVTVTTHGDIIGLRGGDDLQYAMHVGGGDLQHRPHHVQRLG